MDEIYTLRDFLEDPSPLLAALAEVFPYLHWERERLPDELLETIEAFKGRVEADPDIAAVDLNQMSISFSQLVENLSQRIAEETPITSAGTGIFATKVCLTTIFTFAQTQVYEEWAEKETTLLKQSWRNFTAAHPSFQGTTINILAGEPEVDLKDFFSQHPGGKVDPLDIN